MIKIHLRPEQSLHNNFLSAKNCRYDFYHFTISLLSESLKFPKTQSTKSTIEKIVIGKYGIIAIRIEGRKESD